MLSKDSGALSDKSMYLTQNFCEYKSVASGAVHTRDILKQYCLLRYEQYRNMLRSGRSSFKLEVNAEAEDARRAMA